VQTVAKFNPARIDKARLAVNMSRADLAFAVRRVTNGRLKPTEGSISRWAKGTHTPREGVIAAIAAATGQEISFFYAPDGDAEDDEEADLLRDVERLSADLRLRVERALQRRRAESAAR
jgi:transcriptional regulator with XRE-family HTH domain